MATPDPADRRIIERHRADSLVRDERVQRAVNQHWVRTLAKQLDPVGIGVVTVSRRDDGPLVLLDGQHRVLALIERGLGEWEVDCHVYTGLTLAQEAALFRRLNNSRKPNVVDDYLVGVVEGDEECLAIDKIVQSAGLRVALQKGNGIIACVGAMRSVYRKGGANALAPALRVPIAAWGTHSASLEGFIVTGLGEFFYRYGDVIDRRALVRKLAKFPGGPAALIGRAKGLHEMRSGTSIGRCLASNVVDLYNRGRRDQLPPL
jgi:hypothetical protein